MAYKDLLGLFVHPAHLIFRLPGWLERRKRRSLWESTCRCEPVSHGCDAHKDVYSLSHLALNHERKFPFQNSQTIPSFLSKWNKRRYRWCPRKRSASPKRARLQPRAARHLDGKLLPEESAALLKVTGVSELLEDQVQGSNGVKRWLETSPSGL